MQLKTRNGKRQCNTCRRRFTADSNHFYINSSGRLSSECRPCFRTRSSVNQKLRHHGGGVTYHMGYILRAARLRARKFEVPYALDVEFMTCLLQLQGARCALTGVSLTFTKGRGHQPTNASVDRIRPELGYVPGNVQLVAYHVNAMKSNLTLPQLVEWCRLVVSRHDSRSAGSQPGEQGQHHIDQLDPDERRDHATQPVDE